MTYPQDRLHGDHVLARAVEPELWVHGARAVDVRVRLSA
jgi:hypothetical protein